MGRQFLPIVFGYALLVNPAFAVGFKCVGLEKGINSMTGMERVIPISYRVEIINNSATIKELENITFTVEENDNTYILNASIGNESLLRPKSRLLGEYTLKIDKHTLLFSGKSWLFVRENIVTKEGRCEKISDGECHNTIQSQFDGQRLKRMSFSAEIKS